MELRQLEHFVAVAEERHFTRAADLLHISQSGLSASIRALEVELGISLFVRSTRRVELTAAGQALLADSLRTLASAAAARNAVAAVRGLVRGTLSVGAEQCLGSVDLPVQLARFRTANPGIEVRLKHASSSELTESVSTGRVDVALVAVCGPAHQGVRLVPLSTHRLVVLCHPDHPLAHADEIDLSRLREETLVGFPEGWGAQVLASRAFAAAGLDYRVALEVNDVHFLLDLVGHNLGIAIVPETIAAKRPDQLRGVPLRAGMPEWTVAVAVADEPSPAATAFLDQLFEEGHPSPTQARSSSRSSSADRVRSTA